MKMADIILTKDQSDIMAFFSEELPGIRKKFKVSQTMLGKKVGLSRQTISSIERKTVPMTWNTFLSLILFFYANDTDGDKFEHREKYAQYLNDMLLIEE